MYSSKPTTKWDGALFLSSSEPYTPRHKIEQKAVSGRFKGKQFIVHPTKNGREGFFTTMKIWKYENTDPTGPTYRQKRMKMAKKKGFGLGDIADRGEFCDQSRQAEWNERIRSERKAMRSKSSPNLLQIKKITKKPKRKRTRSTKTKSKRRQYDVAHDTKHTFASERFKKYKRPITPDPRASNYIYGKSFGKNKKYLEKSKYVRFATTKEFPFWTKNRHLSTPHLLHKQRNTKSLS